MAILGASNERTTVSHGGTDGGLVAFAGFVTDVLGLAPEDRTEATEASGPLVAASQAGASTAYPVLTGDAARARAAEIAAGATPVRPQDQDFYAENLTDYLDREGSDGRPRVKVIGMYGDVIITAPEDSVSTPEAEAKVLADTIGLLERVAQSPVGGRALAEGQDGLPLVMQVGEQGSRFRHAEYLDTQYTVQAGKASRNFDLMEIDLTQTTTDRQSGAVLTPADSLVHELGHRAQWNDFREQSLSAMSEAERARFPLGHAGYLAPGQRLATDVLDERGQMTPDANEDGKPDGNGIVDFEDMVLVNWEHPYMNERGATVRPRYDAVTPDENSR